MRQHCIKLPIHKDDQFSPDFFVLRRKRGSTTMHFMSLTGVCLVIACCTLLPQKIESKTFSQCELATYLAGQSGITRSHIPTWVCIASNESNRNSNKRSPKNKNGKLTFKLLFFTNFIQISKKKENKFLKIDTNSSGKVPL